MFLLFIAVGLSSFGLIAIPFLNVVPQKLNFEDLIFKPEDKNKAATVRFTIGIVLLLSLAIFLATLNILEAFHVYVSHTAEFIFFGVMIFGLLLFLIIPIISPPYMFPANVLQYTPGENSNSEDSIDGDFDDQEGAPNYNICQSIQTLNFWLFFISCFGLQSAGLMIINNIAQLVESLGGNDGEQVVYVSLLSIANSLGRLIIGSVSDVYKEKINRPLFLVFAVLGMALSNFLMAFADLTLLYVSAPLMGFFYGASWCLQPVLTSEIFGLKHFGANYCLVALAPAIGSFVISTELTSFLYERNVPEGETKCLGKICFQMTFFIIAAMCALCSILSIILYFRTRRLYRNSYRIIPDVGIDLGRSSSTNEISAMS